MDYKSIHDKLTKAYYEDKTISKEVFLKLHKACHLYFEKDEFDAGKPDHVDDDITGRTRVEFIDDYLSKLNVTKIQLQAWE